MTRLYATNPSEATGELAELFAAIKRSVGMVPNAYATLGSNSPPLLAHLLKLNASLQTQSTLSKRELEAINLSVSEDSGCDYCVAAHTLAGKGAGFSTDQMKALRSGSYSEDPKIDSLVKFSLRLANTAGTVPLEALQAVRNAGYTDRQIVETVGAISSILLTNMLNRVNDTSLDFPKVQ